MTLDERKPRTTFTDSRIHGFTDSRIHGFTDSRIHGFTDSRVPRGSRGSRVHGFTGSRVHGFTGSRVHGFTGSRVHGFTGSRVHGQAVEAAHEALNPWWGYPWYDAENDAVKPIKVAEPWQPPDLLSVLGLNLQTLTRALLWLIWILLAALLLWLLYTLWRISRRRTAALEPAGRTIVTRLATARQIESLPIRVSAEEADLLGLAEKCYAEGDYSRAVVYLFSYLLLQLDRRQFIHLARGKTNRQYLRELGSRARLRNLLGHTMQVFEDVFFGNRRLERAQFETCWFELDEFHRLVGFGG